MNLTTRIDIPESRWPLTHSRRMVVMGSCFADEVGERLRADKFRTLVNPFGTIYNPASIAALLRRSLDERIYSMDSPEIFRDATSGRWFSWLHHSTFSARNPDELIGRLNAVTARVGEELRRADMFIVTFGSAVVYRLKQNGRVVGNCHKQPDGLFVREMLTADRIAAEWRPLIADLRTRNPHLRILFTVSPVRHKRDGLHTNQLSKAQLLLAVDALCADSSDEIAYFPAYELLMDELRDYRFYADDLVHPSPLAVDYIYERFTETFVPPAEQALSRACADIAAAVRHRPFDAGGEPYRRFLRQTIQKIHDIQQSHPYLDFEAELSLCNTKLRT